MKALATRYLNEIVGLAVMALMAVALIAGQADAIARHDSAAEAGQLAMDTRQDEPDNLFSFRHKGE